MPHFGGPGHAGVKRIGVMQVIDTLELGGAERVAVNLANALPRERYVSHLCTTRQDGPLSAALQWDVGRLRLGRTRRFEFGALIRLVTYVRNHEIRILHAHGASLFAAVLASLLPPYPAVIWHVHCGSYAEVGGGWLYRSVVWRTRSVIAVSERLAQWLRRRLRVSSSKVRYVPSFVCEDGESSSVPDLPGQRGARIVCVANLRVPKDHLSLVRAMELVVREVPTASLLLVGSERDQGYAEQLRGEISARGLTEHVSFLGDRADVAGILKQCDIGVLSSSSEGLPLALIEYGAARLAAVATDVGQCGEVLADGHSGHLVPPGAPDKLAAALLSLLDSPELRDEFATNLQRRVGTLYTEQRVLGEISQLYQTVLS